ncbi:rhombosortase [Gammaproteobacteria bacterium]|nr:rhombosortase [Gammaproteobacteria bacterium]
MLKDHLALKLDQVAGPLVIAGMAITAQFFGLAELTFDRVALQSGEYWRLLSGHLVHTNDSHLAMSMAGVLALWLLQGDDYNARDYLSVAMISAVGVSACLYYLDTSVNWYAGLSGLLHGLFTWGVTADLRARRHIGPVLVVGLLAKLLLEQTFGAAPASERLLGYPVVIDANLYGAAFGSLSGAIMLFVRREISPEQA